MILDHHGIEFLIIEAKTQTTVGFLDKQDWRTKVGFGWADPTSFKHAINVFLEIIKLSFREIVYRAIERFETRRQWDLMIYTGTVKRELWNFFVFEDIRKLSIFKRNRSRIGGGYGYRIRDKSRNSIRLKSGSRLIAAARASL